MDIYEDRISTAHNCGISLPIFLVPKESTQRELSFEIYMKYVAAMELQTKTIVFIIIFIFCGQCDKKKLNKLTVNGANR